MILKKGPRYLLMSLKTVIECELEGRLIILYFIAVKPLRAPTIRSTNARRSGINEGQGILIIPALPAGHCLPLDHYSIDYHGWKSAESTFTKKVSSSRPDEF